MKTLNVFVLTLNILAATILLSTEFLIKNLFAFFIHVEIEMKNEMIVWFMIQRLSNNCKCKSKTLYKQDSIFL
jgi:hypothetical protein